MRKNNVDGKVLKKLYYTSYEVKGLNLDRLLNTLKRKGVWLFNVKKYGNKRLTLTINASDNKKFFAITQELCYNIKKIKDSGKFYPLLYLYRNVGILLGVLFFALTIYLCNDFIFDVSYIGSGKGYYREVNDYLSARGITRYSKFSSLDLNLLADDILANSGRFSFVSCKRNGNRLTIELAEKSEDTKTLKGNVKELSSDVDGEIESIKVYRGTSLVSVGDLVKKGDVLVSGTVNVNEQEIFVGAIAYFTIKTEKVFTYVSSKDNAEKEALAFVEGLLEDKNVISSSVEKQAIDKEIIYKVKIIYRHILYAG